MTISWDLPDPHVVTVDVRPEDIDVYEHVNNAVYLTWLDRVAWSHSTALGVSPRMCAEIRRGMAALRIEIDYVRAAVLGDPIAIGTWIVASDRKLRVTRRFQVCHALEGSTLARAATEYVCVNLDSGKAVRMPDVFAAAYVPSTGLPARGREGR